MKEKEAGETEDRIGGLRASAWDRQIGEPGGSEAPPGTGFASKCSFGNTGIVYNPDDFSA